MVISSDDVSVSTPPLSNVDLYSSRSIDSVPTTAIRVFGASVGFTGSVGSLTFGEVSPEKFFMAIINDNLSGTSPGRFAELGASPIMVKIELISSSGIVPEGKP